MKAMKMKIGLLAALAATAALALPEEPKNGQAPAERVIVNVEGRLWDEGNGSWANSVATSVDVTVRYDDGQDQVREGKTPLVTDADGYFATAIEVDGSDGSSHNVTSVVVNLIQGMKAETVVTTVPYALVAASAELVTFDETVKVAGVDTVVDKLEASEGVVVKNMRMTGDVTVGSVGGGGNIRLEGVTLTDGALDWFQDGAGKECMDIAGLDFGGEEPLQSVSGTKTWTAEADGFVQVLFVNSGYGTTVSLKVGSVEVTPDGWAGASDRRILWTCPVRAGEEVTLKASGGQCKHQFIVFGK